MVGLPSDSHITGRAARPIPPFRPRVGAEVLAAILFLAAASLSAATPAAAQNVLFRGVDVFDGFRMIRNTNVLVRDGMIRAVSDDPAEPEATPIIDGNGKTLLPGLIDAHTHLGLTFAERFLEDALDFGVTTELEMWGSESSLALRRLMAGEARPNLADLRTAGTGVTVAGGHPTQMGGPPFPVLGAAEDAQSFVDARIEEGSDYIKIIYEHAYPTLTRQQLEAVIAAAHRRNMLVVVHATTESYARDAILAGADGLAHIFADAAPSADFADLVAAHRVFVIPTLSVIEAVTGDTGARWWSGAAEIEAYLTPSMRQTLEWRLPATGQVQRSFSHAEAAVVRLHRAGVPILAGTDAPAPGLAHGVSLHRELELLVRAGLTPLEALAAATSLPARLFGFHDRGRIRVGVRADLLLVDGDPSLDITATRRIVGVWKGGVRDVRAGG